jgi:hypothetical protein
LFSVLKPGGLYIIEDLNWVPSGYERSLPRVARTRVVLADFLKTGRLAPSAAMSPERAAALELQIGNVILFDEGYIAANKRRYFRKHGIDYSFDGRGRAWRGRSGLSRFSDPYFLKYVARQISYSLKSEEFVDRDYIQVAILQKAAD